VFKENRLKFMSFFAIRMSFVLLSEVPTIFIKPL